ncbi:hypothetical protein K470DRAFT_293908 [Piedraia hortae CBS 480.64]|uniref:Retrovirus-related Pol polyprotein from transposon TNT 1-94-like beta-barrel domain-containing protein n=1 Tax=Piedraia hortae CBS 480.64 TaxID=1314780 RepID=A0A6A7C4Q0_9PEZI|nr:hypothetical protein K470DRAFT_293908 [Piedraia hortae CBS 480.64]
MPQDRVEGVKNKMRDKPSLSGPTVERDAEKPQTFVVLSRDSGPLISDEEFEASVILDQGAEVNIANSMNRFVGTLEPVDEGSIMISENQGVLGIGSSKINLTVSNEQSLEIALQNTLYVPDMPTDIVSKHCLEVRNVWEDPNQRILNLQRGDIRKNILQGQAHLVNSSEPSGLLAISDNSNTGEASN